MKRVVMTVIFSLIVAVAVFAQNPQQPAQAKAPNAASPADQTPSVDQIIDKAIQASGGKAAIEKLNSRSEKGSFEIPAMGASGSFENYSKAPNKTVLIINVPGFGTVQEGFNGTVAWSQDPMSGLREKAGTELAAAKLDSEFYKALKLKELYPKMTVNGKAKVGDRDAYVIEAVPAATGPEKMYFDVQTGLLIRHDVERETPHGKMPVEIYFDDYREVDGVKIPFSMRQVTPAFTLSVKLDEVKHNVPVDDAKFNKPAN